MQRYFIDSSQYDGSRIQILSDDAHHIKNVMRGKIGDTIYCVLSPNQVLEAKIYAFEDKIVIAEVVRFIEENRELPITVTIAQGLPKGEKLEWVLQKGTELGMHHYVPLQMERSIVKLDAKKTEKRLERWNKIVKEAAEQSYRNLLPTISSVQNLKQLTSNYAHYTYKLIAYEEEAKKEHSKKCLQETFEKVKAGESIIIVFGPEGGISEKEIGLLKGAGFLPCALGPRILRTETAPLYFLSALSYKLE